MARDGDDDETRQVKAQLWAIHCAGDLAATRFDDPPVLQLEQSMAPMLRGMPLRILWNTSIEGAAPAPAALSAPRGVEPAGFSNRAFLYSGNNEERDDFLVAVDGLYAGAEGGGGTASASGGGAGACVPVERRPVWYCGEGELNLDPPSMPRDVAAGFQRSPVASYHVARYLRALCSWRDQRRRVVVQLRLVPSPRCPRTPYASLGTSQLKQLVVLAGTVVRIGTSVSVCQAMVFRCSGCGARRTVSLDDVVEYPTECNAGKCKSRAFAPDPACAGVRCLSVHDAAAQRSGALASDMERARMRDRHSASGGHPRGCKIPTRHASVGTSACLTK